MKKKKSVAQLIKELKAKAKKEKPVFIGSAHDDN